MTLLVKGDVAAVREWLEKHSIAEFAERLREGGFDPALVVVANFASNFWHEKKSACEVAKLLVHYGARPDIAGQEGSTALHIAARSSADLLKILLSAKERNVDVKQRQTGETPLHHTIGYFAEEQCRLLIEAKADVDVRDNEGNTTLMRAVEHAEASIVVQLLSAGADTSVKNASGKTALDVSGDEASKVEICKGIIRSHVEKLAAAAQRAYLAGVHEIAFSELQLLEQIGSGGFGDVFVGKWSQMGTA